LTGLYYYGAKYYDAVIGRFISPDTVVPDPMNPQTFNRYSYCLNNPLKYTDPIGGIVVLYESSLKNITILHQPG
jgi:RHS repeat-associated protein